MSDEPLRVRLEPVSGPALPGYRWLRSSSTHLLVDGPWSADVPSTLPAWKALAFLLLIAAFVLSGLTAGGVFLIAWFSIFDLVGAPHSLGVAALGATVVVLALLVRRAWDPELLWRGWRLEPGCVTREGQQIVGRIGARRFPEVTEFEIVHIVETRSSFGPSDVGSRDGIDTLQFRTARESEAVIVAVRRFHTLGRRSELEQ